MFWKRSQPVSFDLLFIICVRKSMCVWPSCVILATRWCNPHLLDTCVSLARCLVKTKFKIHISYTIFFMFKKVLNIKLLHALMHFFGGTCGVMSDFTVNVSHST